MILVTVERDRAHIEVQLHQLASSHESSPGVFHPAVRVSDIDAVYIEDETYQTTEAARDRAEVLLRAAEDASGAVLSRLNLRARA